MSFLSKNLMFEHACSRVPSLSVPLCRPKRAFRRTSLLGAQHKPVTKADNSLGVLMGASFAVSPRQGTLWRAESLALTLAICTRSSSNSLLELSWRESLNA